MNVFHDAQTTMTPEEAEAIVRRHLERTPETPNGPTVADMAEALRVSPEEVAKLLAEVRAEPGKRRLKAVSQRERRMWLLSGVLALAVGAAGLGAMMVAGIGPFRGTESVVAIGPATEPFSVEIDGADYGSVYYNEEAGTMSQELPKLVRNWMGENMTRIVPTQSYSFESSEAAVVAAKAGRWADIQGVRMSVLELKKPVLSGVYVRWARAIVPIYNGDDALVAEAVDRERTKRIAKAVETAMKGIPPPGL